MAAGAAAGIAAYFLLTRAGYVHGYSARVPGVGVQFDADNVRMILSILAGAVGLFFPQWKEWLADLMERFKPGDTLPTPPPVLDTRLLSEVQLMNLNLETANLHLENLVELASPKP